MSLFAGMARQAAALPPIQPQAPPQRGRGLFGGGRQPDPNAIGLMERIAMAGQALGGGGTYQGIRRSREQEIAAQGMAEQQRQQREQFAATIQDPRERQLFMSAPDEWAKNVGQQFAPQVVGAGAAQVVNGARTVEQPTYSESGDTILERSSAGVNPVFTRTTPSISEGIAKQNADTTRDLGQGNLAVAQQNANTSRITAQRPQAVTTGVGAVTSLIGTDGSISGQIQGNAPPPNPAMVEANQAVEGFKASNDRFRNLMTMVEGDAERGIAPAFELSPMKAVQYEIELATGRTSPEAAAWANYNSELDSAVSDALRLNTGPQTDQDAIREARALLSNRNNKAYVLERLPTIIANNERLAQARMAGVQPQGQSAAQGGQASPQVIYDPQGNPYVVRNGQWVPQ